MRMGKRALSIIIAVAVLVSGGAAIAAPAAHNVARVQPPNDWVRHAKAPWTWWTPRHWVAAHGAHDLNISSPTGALWNKFGFSEALYSATLTPAGNAAAWFQYVSANQLQGSLHTAGLYSFPLRSDSYTAIGAIRQIPPVSGFTYAWEQIATFKGRRTDGVRIRGRIVMDYAANPPSAFDPYGNGGESFQVQAAPRQGFANSFNTLKLVQSLITYCGSVC
jgi:hypothetical protein